VYYTANDDKTPIITSTSILNYPKWWVQF